MGLCEECKHYWGHAAHCARLIIETLFHTPETPAGATQMSIDKSIEPAIATSLMALRLIGEEMIGAREGTRSSVRVYKETPDTIALQVRVQQLRQVQIAHARLTRSEAEGLVALLQEALAELAAPPPARADSERFEQTLRNLVHEAGGGQ